MNAGSEGQPSLSESRFHELYERLRDSTTWGPADRRGALNNVTPATVSAAAGEVRSGRTVSLAAPVEDWLGADNPEPSAHRMTSPAEGHIDPTGLQFALDRFSMNVHGNADSHLDALCHVVYNGELYNGVASDSVTPTGATTLSVDVARHGIVGRGVLLDIPRVRGVPWLEPGQCVTADDLVAAENAHHLRVGQGDVVLVRVGHRRRRMELGPWNAAERRAGLDPLAMEFMADRRVAALGSDGNNDTAPSTTAGVAFPVHVLAVNALGLQLLDYLQFEDLVPLCEDASRWSFLCVIAPLRLPTATGSPVNPIAVL